VLSERRVQTGSLRIDSFNNGDNNMPDDNTFHSNLVKFIKENELEFISSSDPEIMARYIEGCIFNYNEIKVLNDDTFINAIKKLQEELVLQQNKRS
jgi:CRISPR/Cas system endoribonuclease Cas6 (RAMP superfamily)